MTTAISTLPASLVSLSATAERRYHVYPLISGSKKRWIEAPDRELKAAQRWLLDEWLYRLEPTDLAHGFIPGRSIVSNASCHVGRDWVVTTDLRNFFPSIRSPRVAESIAELDQPAGDVETIIGLVTRRGRLPQGAPTSPHLANLVARRLDLRLAGLARNGGWTYTRYADDLTFSGNGDPQRLLGAVEKIVRDEGFRQAEGKTHLMSRHQRQVVTGLVVNDRVSLPKPRRRLLRAMLHRLQTAGPDAVDLRQFQVVHGHLALAKFVNPDGFAAECRELARLIRSASTPRENNAPHTA